MAENTPEYGDDKFKEFLNKMSDKNEGDPLELILNSIKFKLESITTLYTKTISVYSNMEKNDPLKDKVLKYLNQLIDHSIETLNQFNYALIDFEEDDEVDNENNNNDTNEDSNDGEKK